MNLSRDELINLLCTTDGKGKEAKLAALRGMFESVDKIAEDLLTVHQTWSEIKALQDEKSRLIVDLLRDRDAWKTIALKHEAQLVKLGQQKTT